MAEDTFCLWCKAEISIIPDGAIRAYVCPDCYEKARDDNMKLFKEKGIQMPMLVECASWRKDK